MGCRTIKDFVQMLEKVGWKTVNTLSWLAISLPSCVTLPVSSLLLQPSLLFMGCPQLQQSRVLPLSSLDCCLMCKRIATSGCCEDHRKLLKSTQHSAWHGVDLQTVEVVVVSVFSFSLRKTFYKAYYIQAVNIEAILCTRLQVRHWECRCGQNSPHESSSRGDDYQQVHM